jgi:hypothetical protein
VAGEPCRQEDTMPTRINEAVRGLKSPEELADFIKKAMIKAFPDLAERDEKDKKKDK